MIGLTWGDIQLNFTLIHYGVILLNLLLWTTQKPSFPLVCLTTGLIFAAFWNTSIALDTSLLFYQAERLHHLSWGAFLTQLPTERYIQYQTPFYPFFVSRFPTFWLQQLFLVPLVLGNSLTILKLFGERGKWVLATPLYFVLSSQPGTDIFMFSLVILSLRAYQLGILWASSLLYGFSWIAKPLTITALPFMALYLRWWIFPSLLIWWGYTQISTVAKFGQIQNELIRHQLFLKPIKRYGGKNWRQHAFFWRLNYVTKPAIPAFFMWLFPLYTNRMTIMCICACLCILFGYGNIKYFSLWQLFIFPLQKVNYAT